ncbi:MAG: hypothetical protein ABIZ80_14975 [Bryobacteraceae bacterium]
MSNQKQIAAVKRRVQAHLLELRVFSDEPVVMWNSQKSLFRANLRYMALMLRPALFLTLPLAILAVYIDGYYGRSPLPVGEPAVVTVAMRTPLDPQSPPPKLVPPPYGFVVETEGVRVMEERQMSWRIRPSGVASGALRLIIDGRTIDKTVEAGAGVRFLSSRRVSSLIDSIRHPGEARIDDHAVEWIEIQYPEAGVQILRFRTHWLVWFTLVSMMTAVLLKKWMGVVL